MQLQANTAWFTLSLNGRSDFQVYSFTGRESVSRPYMFTLELVNPSAWNGEKCIDDTNYFDANLVSEVAYTEKYEFWELK